MNIAGFSHGGNIYNPAYRSKKRLIDFSASINPLGLPEGTKKLLFENITVAEHYPDLRADDIITKIAGYWGVEKESVAVGNGSVELLYDLLRVFKPKTITIPEPSFNEYERAARLNECRIDFVRLSKEKGFCFDPLKINPSDMLLLANPNSPTANLLIRTEVDIEKIPAKIIVIDEAFMDFIPEERSLSWINKIVYDKRIIVLRTFTKFFSIPGLRFGFMIADKDIIGKVKNQQVPWNVNMPAQLAAADLINQKDYRQETYSFIEKERAWLSLKLWEMKLFKIYPSCANFLFLKIIDSCFNGGFLEKKLIEKGILIRNCADFRSLDNSFLRIAVRKRKENEILIRALTEILLET